MPKHTASLVVKGIEKLHKCVETARVTVLGAGYKGECGDVRNSPSKKVVRNLLSLGAKVTIFDPYSHEGFGAKVAEDLYQAIADADCTVILTDHSLFKKLDLKKVKRLMSSQPLIIDGRLLVKPEEARGLGFLYFGVGIS